MTGAERMARWILPLLAGYFALQFALRLALGGALETDEAEMVLLTPGFRLGYGPQLPLYGWLQAASFAVFGVNTFALALVKNVMLFGIYALTFAALRPVLPARMAVAGLLGLALLPDLFWEGQRATTHSVALMLMIAALLAAVSSLLRRGRMADYLWLGLALGLGGLSKYNFWLVPPAMALAALGLPLARARLADRRMLISLGIAAAIMAAPAIWMLQNPELALASGGKLDLGRGPQQGLPWLQGLAEAGTGLAAGLGLAALVAAGLRFGLRGRGPEGPPPPEPPSEPGATVLSLLARSAAIAYALFLLGVVVSGTDHVTSRWLLPVFLLAAPPLLAGAVARARPVAVPVLAGIVAGLFALTVVGMAGARMLGPARGALDLDALEAAIAPLAPQDRVIVTDFYLGGNLKLRHPDWQVQPALPLSPQPEAPVLLLARGRGQGWTGDLADSGWTAEGWAETQVLTAEIPFRYSADDRLRITARLVSPP
ncbi:glycosyltransferase family 39 protein [Frigidibacter oleivorans]|uniref:glycosyltransferase family 39 protein n=1 Tax=Frigidibacter oleivorans TaxID=2487129 RepID=UPI0013E0AB31|nr:glycosyltransferase family 39 protein [Frigidibacter oleivorans]